MIVPERWNMTGAIAYPFREDQAPVHDTGEPLDPGALRDLTFIVRAGDLTAHALQLTTINRAVGDIELVFQYPGQSAPVLVVFSAPTEVAEITESTADWQLSIVVGPEIAAGPGGARPMSNGWVEPSRIIDYRRHRVTSLGISGEPALTGDVKLVGRNGVTVSNAPTQNAIRLSAVPGSGTGYPCISPEITIDRDIYTLTYTPDIDPDNFTVSAVLTNGPAIGFSVFTPAGLPLPERMEVLAAALAANLIAVLDVQHIPFGADSGRIIVSVPPGSYDSITISDVNGPVNQTPVTPTSKWSIPRVLVFSTADRVVRFSVGVRWTAYPGLLLKELGYLVHVVTGAVPAWDDSTSTLTIPGALTGSVEDLHSAFMALFAPFHDVFEVSSIAGVTPIIEVADETERLATTMTQRRSAILQLDTGDFWRWSAGFQADPDLTVVDIGPVFSSPYVFDVDPGASTVWGPDISTVPMVVSGAIFPELDGLYYLPPGSSEYQKGTLDLIDEEAETVQVNELSEIVWDPGEPPVERLSVTDVNSAEISGVYYRIDGSTDFLKGDLNTTGPTPQVDNVTHELVPVGSTFELLRENGTRLLYSAGAVVSEPWDAEEWRREYSELTAVTHRLRQGPFNWEFVRESTGDRLLADASSAASPDVAAVWLIVFEAMQEQRPAFTDDYTRFLSSQPFSSGTATVVPSGVNYGPGNLIEQNQNGTWSIDYLGIGEVSRSTGTGVVPSDAGPWLKTPQWGPTVPRTADEDVELLTDQFGFAVPALPVVRLAFGGDLLAFISCLGTALWINGQPAGLYGDFNLSARSPLRIVPDPDNHALILETAFIRGTGGSLDCLACLTEDPE